MTISSNLNDRERREFDYLQQKWRVPNPQEVLFYQEEKLGVEILIFDPMAVEADLRDVKR